MEIVKEIKGKRVDLVLYEVSDAVPEKKYVDTLSYNIVLKNNVKIGTISAKLGMNDIMYYIGNIGFNIDEPYRGNGYAGESVLLLKEVFLKNDMPRVIITNDPKNEASVRVCEKLGAELIETAKVPKEHILFEQGHKYENIWLLTF